MIGKYIYSSKGLPSTKSFERNSRLSVAKVKNKAAQNYLNIELGHLEKEKKTALRMLQNDKQSFKLKYFKSSDYGDSGPNEVMKKEKQQDNVCLWKRNTTPTLNKYYVPSFDKGEEQEIGDSTRRNSHVEFQQIHNMLFTNDEIDIEKIMCLHLISAHRTESLAPAKKKLSYMCKIHSPLERLLERSKRKNIHLEQRMTNMLPIYTIEVTEFGTNSEQKDLINDGRLATRILLNEKVRELINTVLNALKQSNPEKNYEIFELANDVGALKKLFTQRKLLDFMDELMTCPLINSCESFILTAPFRVKSNQLEIRTITGTLELLVKQIRQNVLQLPPRTLIKTENTEGEADSENKTKKKLPGARMIFRKKMAKRKSNEDTPRNIEGLYSDKQARHSSDPEKRLGRHVDIDFIQRNIQAAANAKKVEYDTDDEGYFSSRRSSQSSNRTLRRSSDGGSIIDRPNIQPIRLPDEVAVIMEENNEIEDKKENDGSSTQTDISDTNSETEKEKDVPEETRFQKRKSGTDSDNVKIHLKQTTCPACMERYKIPLPAPKTPRVKVSSVLPPAPGENPDLKTNSQNRLSMLINKEMFKLQSYERRFSSEEHSRRNRLKKKEIADVSSSHLNLSPLELAKIEQQIREKETQKKLEKFLQN